MTSYRGVMTSLQGGKWEEEKKEGGYPNFFQIRKSTIDQS